MKVISLCLLIGVISFLDQHGLCGAALLIACSLLHTSKLPRRFVWRRIRYPAFLLLLLGAFLALTSGGEPVYSWNGISVYRDGTHTATIVFLRCVSILMLFFVLIETSPFHVTIKALHSLGVPGKIVSMISFAYRFIFTYFDDLRKMRDSLRLRGYHQKGLVRNLSTSTGVIGSLIIRSFEHAERVSSAMLLRGYSGEPAFHHEFAGTRSDWVKSALCLAVSVALAALHLYL